MKKTFEAFLNNLNNIRTKATTTSGSLPLSLPQRPRFLAPDYEARVAEDARGGAEVARLEAADPDGRDEELRFHIHSGAKDNFVIDGRSGVLSVAPDANLDIQRSGDTYDIQVCTKRTENCISAWEIRARSRCICT